MICAKTEAGSDNHCGGSGKSHSRICKTLKSVITGPLRMRILGADGERIREIT